MIFFLFSKEHFTENFIVNVLKQFDDEQNKKKNCWFRFYWIIYFVKNKEPHMIFQSHIVKCWLLMGEKKISKIIKFLMLIKIKKRVLFTT